MAKQTKNDRDLETITAGDVGTVDINDDGTLSVTDPVEHETDGDGNGDDSVAYVHETAESADAEVGRVNGLRPENSKSPLYRSYKVVLTIDESSDETVLSYAIARNPSVALDKVLSNGVELHVSGRCHIDAVPLHGAQGKPATIESAAAKAQSLFKSATQLLGKGKLDVSPDDMAALQRLMAAMQAAK